MDEDEHTFEEFERIWNRLLENGKFDQYDMMVEFGDYDGEPFIIFNSWEQREAFHALITGYEGDCDLIHLCGWNDLEEEYVKIQMKLEKAQHENMMGSVYRYETELRRMDNARKYRQWLVDNDITPLTVDDFGIEWGFSDEFTMCGCCNTNVVRTSPDSYCWTPPVELIEYGYLCHDCALNMKADVLEDYCNQEKNLPDDFDPELDFDLVKVNEESFENGYYGGQRDTPQPIIKALNAHNIDVWFRVYPRQFDVSFDVYVREEDHDLAVEILSQTDVKAKDDPAVMLKRGLQCAAKQMSKLDSEDGIKYCSIKDDGTCDCRIVSPEEFVDGIKRE